MTANTGQERERNDAAHPEQPRGAIPSDSFANRLVLARTIAGHLSIREAADMCGLGRGAWTNWERGARPYDKPEVCQIISDKLGVDFHWLLFGGPLLPARGRPVKRSGHIRPAYVARTVRVALGHPNGGGRRITSGSPGQPIRQPRVIDRTQPVAA